MPHPMIKPEPITEAQRLKTMQLGADKIAQGITMLRAVGYDVRDFEAELNALNGDIKGSIIEGAFGSGDVAQW